MALTFGQLQYRIKTRLLDKNSNAVDVPDVQLSINQAVGFYKSKRFWFNQGVGLVTSVAGNAAAVLPTDFQFPIPNTGMVLIYNNTVQDLVRYSPGEFNSLSSGGGQGLPYGYTWNGGTYSLYPIPDQNYQFQVNYIKDYPDLVNDSDTNDFLTYADRLIEYDALSRLQGEIRQDEKMEAYYSARALNELTNLVSATAKRTATGRLSVEQLY